MVGPTEEEKRENAGTDGYSQDGSTYTNATGTATVNSTGNPFVDEGIAQASAAWWYAHARGDQEGMDAAHQQAEEYRGAMGYSGGDDGTQYIPLSSESTGSPGTGTGGTANRNTSTGSTATGLSYDNSNIINDLYASQKSAQMSAIEQALGNTVSGYNAQIGALPASYDPLRAQSELDKYKSGRSLQENLASTGQIAGGQGRQDTLNLNTAYNAQLGSINRQEQAQVDELKRLILAAQESAELEKLKAGYDIDSLLASALLNDKYVGTQNLFTEAGLTGYLNGTRTVAGQSLDQDADQFGQTMDYNYNALQQDNDQFNAGLAQDADQFDQSMGYSYAALQQDQEQFNASLSQGDAQFYAALASEEAMFYASLSQQDQHFYDSLSQEDQQFYAHLYTVYGGKLPDGSTIYELDILLHPDRYPGAFRSASSSGGSAGGGSGSSGSAGTANPPNLYNSYSMSPEGIITDITVPGYTTPLTTQQIQEKMATGEIKEVMMTQADGSQVTFYVAAHLASAYGAWA